MLSLNRTLLILPSACGALALAPQALAAATINVPSSAAAGERITVSASGLSPGRYRLVLAKNITPPGAMTDSACAAPFGPEVLAREGSVTIAGAIPKRLACNSAAGPIEGHISTSAGKYLLDLGHYVAPIFKGSESFLKTTIHVTG